MGAQKVTLDLVSHRGGFDWGGSVPSDRCTFVFLALSALTLCAGHSVGMHRLMIHRSFETPLWVEHVLIWLGTLVGMAGPLGMIRTHDLRDWHQRQTSCPPHPSHGAGFWRDAWWQMHWTYRLNHPPKFQVEAAIATDRFYRWLQRTWMAQQVPLAVVLLSDRWMGLGAVGRVASDRGVADRPLDGRALRPSWRESGVADYRATCPRLQHSCAGLADIRRELARQSSCFSTFGVAWGGSGAS